MADSMLNLNPREPKIARQEPDWTKCVCHVRQEQDDLSGFNDQSWDTLKRAAEIRQDQIFLQLKDHWDKGPIGVKHRKCYQSYTNKTLLDRLKKKRDESKVVGTMALEGVASTSDSPMESEHARSSRTSTPVPQTEEVCIFCQTKRKRCGKKIENLSQCLSFEADERVTKSAERKNDHRLLLAIRCEDLVATEVKYHKSCYRGYTKGCEIASDVGKEEERALVAKSPENQAHARATESLVKFIQKRVIQDLDVLKMTDVKEQYVKYLESNGIDARTYRTEKVKKKLIKVFENKLGFWHPSCKSETEMVYAMDVPTGQIIEVGVSASQNPAAEERPFAQPNVDNCSAAYQVFHAAKMIRAEIQNMENKLPWPPRPEDLTTDNIQVPDLLFNFLCWVLYGDAASGPVSEDRVEVPVATCRTALSLAQDLVHCTTGGRIKNPKHVALPMTVKHLTRSVQLVEMLNKFGHGLCNDLIQEVETAFAQRYLTNIEEDGVYIPKTIHPNVPVVFCWDNNDINEETLSGHGTTHCTNGIVIQREVQSVQEMPEANPINVRRSSLQPQPSHIEHYMSGKRQGPCLNMLKDGHLLPPNNTESSSAARIKDISWGILRITETDNSNNKQTVPGWTGFNSMLYSENAPAYSLVGYCPVIEASPTELDTVYTLLKRSVAMGKKLGQDDIIIVMDQAIYAKAQEIVLQRNREFENVVLRMGSFHVITTFLAVIGKRYADAGLVDILIESGVIAYGSMNGVLEGRHYNRAIRAHKIVLEALFRLKWKAFIQWLQHRGLKLDSLADVEEQLKDLRKELCPETYEAFIQNTAYKDIIGQYEIFCKEEHGVLFSFWDSYIEMIMLLLRFIRATRIGCWDLHLLSVREMLPWMFAYDRTNYARYLTLYWCEMTVLPESHPQAFRALEQGQFAVQRSRGGTFSQVPVDQTIEQTLNRDTKTKGGIIGISLNRGAVQRWILTAHDRADVARQCRILVGIQDCSNPPKDEGISRMKKDEKDVQSVMCNLQTWVNPFELRESDDSLVNLASGVVASQEVSDALLSANLTGEQQFKKFVNERIRTQKVDFFNPLSKLNLPTFSTLLTTKQIKSMGKDVVLKADRGLFARMIVMAQNRQMDMRAVLTYPLGPLPWSLATTDGTLAKTTKSSLLHILEAYSPVMNEIPESATWIIDGMALLQTLKDIPKTFSAFAVCVLRNVMASLRPGDQRVDFVTDQYPQISIKYVERAKRSQKGVIKVSIQSPDQKCPTQFSKYLSLGQNKTDLVHFLFREWNQDCNSALLQNVMLFVAHGNQCHRLTSAGDQVVCVSIPELSTEQEEADTRMLLHAQHAALHGATNIVIKSPDTDVAVIASALSPRIPSNVLFLTGTKQRRRCINVTAIGRRLGRDVTEALPGLHAFTGCDTTSAFVGKGKQSAFDLVLKDPGMCNCMKKVGEQFGETADLYSLCEEFVCSLYRCPGRNVHNVRYKLFCSRSSESCSLPPTRDALEKHANRANYQSAIWRKALEKDCEIPSPHGHGWNVKEGELFIHWMDQEPAPKALMELVSCKCKTGCNGRRCSCHKVGLLCTDVCECIDCENSGNNPDNDSDGDEGDID